MRFEEINEKSKKQSRKKNEKYKCWYDIDASRVRKLQFPVEK